MCFNPRTHEGCDMKNPCKSSPPRLFQSTHPRGVRQAETDTRIKALQVSIHAPTRGATDKIIITYIVTISFNPRTHEGCDVCGFSFLFKFLCFNPRTHEGCDSSIQRSSTRLTSFNPRTHEGCDPNLTFT